MLKMLGLGRVGRIVAVGEIRRKQDGPQRVDHDDDITHRMD
jgi:hypothetical protein